MSDANTFTGQQQDIDWHDFCRKMEKDTTAREAFAAILQLAEITLDSDMATFLADPSSANLASAIGDTTVSSSGSVARTIGDTLISATLEGANFTDTVYATGSVDVDLSGSSGDFSTTTGTTALKGDVIVDADKDVTMGAGTGSVDLSLGTGTFDSTTGDNTLNGDVTIAANKDLVMATGTGEVDLSGASGTFKTPTGTNTIGGTVSLAANKNIACAAGTTAVDWSLGTGVTKTTTGLNTLGGLAALKTIATPVAATGAAGGVAGAAALGAANIVAVSSDGATKGVKFPTSVAGEIRWVINTSGTACNLFAASGGTINGGSADAGCTIPASKGVLAISTAADTWIVSDFTARAGAAA